MIIIILILIIEGAILKKDVLKSFAENTCARVSFFIKQEASDYSFIKNETLAQVFSCEFCEICKNTFFLYILFSK